MTNVAGAICIGQVVALYMTTRGRRGGGAPHWGRNERCPPLFSLSSGLRVASRRVLPCTLRILHTKHMRTLNRRPSAHWTISDESDVSNNNAAQRLSDGARRLPFVRATGSGLARRRNAFALSRFATITASPKLRTHDDINGIPAHFTSISNLLDFGPTAAGIE